MIRSLDYEIAGIIAGGVFGLLLANFLSIGNEELIAIIFSILGFLFFKPLMRRLK